MEEGISRRRFIRLGGALGVGAASASVLAACGGGGSESGGSGGGSGNGSGGGSGNATGNASENATENATGNASGNADGGNAGGGGSDKSGGSKKKAGGGQAIAQASEVAPGSAVDFKDSGGPAVLVHLDTGDFVAYSAVCTHQGCTVAYGDGQLVCPCHGSIFDPANGGEVINGPAQTPLPEIPVEVRGGDVLKA